MSSGMKSTFRTYDSLPLFLRMLNVLILFVLVILMGIPMVNVLAVSLSTVAKATRPILCCSRPCDAGGIDSSGKTPIWLNRSTTPSMSRWSAPLFTC